MLAKRGPCLVSGCFGFYIIIINSQAICDRQITEDLSKSSGGFGCTCSRGCGKRILPTFAAELRFRLVSCPTEGDATEMITAWLSLDLPTSRHAGYILSDGVTRHSTCAKGWYGVCAVPLIPPSEFFFRTLSFQISAAKFYKCVGLARQHQGRGVAVIHGNTGKVDYSASQYTTSHGCHYSGIFWERVLTRSDVHCLSVLLHRALLQYLRGGSNALAPGTDTEGRVRTRVS